MSAAAATPADGAGAGGLPWSGSRRAARSTAAAARRPIEPDDTDHLG
jgi:hypothetical protein